MNRTFWILSAFLLGGLFPAIGISAASADEPPQSLYIIYDSSGSMWGELPDKSRKYETARSVLKDFLSGDFAGRQLAFRAYGHRKEGDCRDSELVVPFGEGENVGRAVEGAMESIRPLGKTPITYSLRQALSDFGERKGDIILITDGLETCDIDPCELMREWQANKVSIKVHVVGLGLNDKEKAALQCVSEVSGTAYQDAQSASELAEGLKSVQAHTGIVRARLDGTDAAGAAIPVAGAIVGEDGESLDISSGRFTVLAKGKYRVTAGVRTANGDLYKPISFETEIVRSGDTLIPVKAETPPIVHARFVESGEEVRGALIRAYRGGKEVFTLHPGNDLYVNEGGYEFRSKVNNDNDLTIAESFAAGDRKEIVFGLVKTVVATIKLVTADGERFGANMELWQNGAKRYDVHMNNGVKGLPGVYDVVLKTWLWEHVEKGVTLTDQPKQAIEIVIPSGSLTVIYQNADGSRAADKRVRITRAGSRDGRMQGSGKPIPLTPGQYELEGWGGTYDKALVEIQPGDKKEVVLKDKGPAS